MKSRYARGGGNLPHARSVQVWQHSSSAGRASSATRSLCVTSWVSSLAHLASRECAKREDAPPVRPHGPARRWPRLQGGAPGFRNGEPCLPDAPLPAQQLPLLGPRMRKSGEALSAGREESRMDRGEGTERHEVTRAPFPVAATSETEAEPDTTRISQAPKRARRRLAGRPNAPERCRQHGVAGCRTAPVWLRCWTRFRCLAKWPPNFLLASGHVHTGVRMGENAIAVPGICRPCANV